MTVRRTEWLGKGVLTFLFVAGLVLACWLGFQASAARSLHADEAGQWSLMVEAHPHSETRDRFHGPALVSLARAALAILRIDPAEASEGVLRAVPLVVALTLLLSSFVRRHRSAPFLGLLAIAPCARFIQEPVLAVALTWAALLWLREDEVESRHLWRLRFAAGAAVGLALACKVTAALYVGAAATAYLWIRRDRPSKGGLAVFWGSAAFFWAYWQSSFFTDVRGLVTWWEQLGRAFGVAAGVTEEPLRLVSAWPWVVSSALLGLAGYGRWRRRAEAAFGRHRLDPLLAACVAVLLLHVALPYKTPWLLMTLDMLVLVVLLPELLVDDLCQRLDERVWRLVQVLIVVMLSSGVFRWVSAERYAYAETSPSVPVVARAIRSAARSRPLLIQVRGANDWPLPYYLRGLQVGYGEFAGAAQAEVRWLEAVDAEAPSAPGYRTFPVEVRRGELWWVLARGDVAAAIETALRDR